MIWGIFSGYPSVNVFVTKNGDLYTGTNNGMFCSKFNGQDWNTTSAGLQKMVIRRAIVCNDNIYVSSPGNGIFKSTDSGTTWDSCNTGLNGKNIISFAVNNSSVYAGDSAGKIYKLSIDGSKWLDISPISLSSSINALLAFNNVLIAGTSENGILITKNDGKDWSQFNSGLYYNDCYALATNGVNVYAGVYSYVWTCPISDIITNVDGEKALPNDPVLQQNYPNPFNPTTTIQYSIPIETTHRAVSTTLKVYDVLGREVATLVNEEKLPGNYQINFDASKLSSGIYFYKITAGSFVLTKKMVLMK
jgi:hypothetical protein